MKKILSLILISIAFSTGVFARPLRRITFPKGATEVVVTGQLSGFKDSQIYMINLRSDQNFTVEGIGDKYVTISVFDSNGKNLDDPAADCHSSFSLPKTRKGDYKIVVTECLKADSWKGAFKIKVSAVNNKK